MYIRVGDMLINLDQVTTINLAATCQRYNSETEQYDQIDNCVRFSFGGVIARDFIGEEADAARAEIQSVSSILLLR